MSKVELIDFYAPWCAPCQAMMPVVHEIEKEYKDKITVSKVNIDENGDEAAKNNIMSVPTFIFKKDGVIANQLMGMQPKDNLVATIDKLLG